MTDIRKRLENLSETDKSKLSDLFVSLSDFYETVYLIVKNGHHLQMEAESKNNVANKFVINQKIQTVEYYKEAMERKLDAIGLNGKEWVADIASDYFEDYVHYREPQLSIIDEVFYKNLNALTK